MIFDSDEFLDIVLYRINLVHLSSWSGIINWASSCNDLHQQNPKTVHITPLVKHTRACILRRDVSAINDDN